MRAAARARTGTNRPRCSLYSRPFPAPEPYTYIFKTTIPPIYRPYLFKSAVLCYGPESMPTPLINANPCPGPHCIYCRGAACNTCGIRRWASAGSRCDHDAEARHAGVEPQRTKHASAYPPTIINRYPCPGPECHFCKGAACNSCGAGCWNGAGPHCEHDVVDRHVGVEPRFVPPTPVCPECDDKPSRRCPAAMMAGVPCPNYLAPGEGVDGKLGFGPPPQELHAPPGDDNIILERPAYSEATVCLHADGEITFTPDLPGDYVVRYVHPKPE